MPTHHDVPAIIQLLAHGSPSELARRLTKASGGARKYRAATVQKWRERRRVPDHALLDMQVFDPEFKPQRYESEQ